METDKKILELFLKACEEGYYNIICYCIGLNIDINAVQGRFTFTGLNRSVLGNHYKVVDLLLKQSEIDVNRKNELRNGSITALICACYENNYEIVGRLLCHPDIDVNASTSKGNTALHYGAEYGYWECVKLLMDHPGIDVNKKNHDGESPVMVAVSLNQKTIVELLIQDNRTDMKTRNKTNMTLSQVAM